MVGGPNAAPGGNFGNMPPAAGTGGTTGAAGMGGSGPGGTGNPGAGPVPPPPAMGSGGTGANPMTPAPGVSPAGATDTDFSGCEVQRFAPPGPTAQGMAPLPPLADAGAPVSCEHALPPDATPFLPDLLNVQVVTPESTRITLRRVNNAAACDPTRGGYYYDDAAKPTRIVVCATHCDLPIEIVLGCPTIR